MNRRPAALALCACALTRAGEFPRTLYAYPGVTPIIDGALSPGEWDDAVQFQGVSTWTAQLAHGASAGEPSVRVYMKHDGRQLFFAFDVSGSAAPGNWVELSIDAANRWTGRETAAGDGSSWRVRLNVATARLEGAPRGWIGSGAQRAAVRAKPGGNGYVVEWAVSFNPCIEIAPGAFYSPALGDRALGLNVAIEEDGAGAPLRRWWLAGARGTEAQLRQWGTLWMKSKPVTQQQPMRILRD